MRLQGITRNILKIHGLCLILVVSGFTANAQIEAEPDRYMSSPSAAELGSYGEVPVGLFTGMPEVNVPLYELKTRNLTLPISLNYRSSGLQVNKVSSNVGFDWSLFAGGVINRIVKGHPDEHQNFSWANFPVDPQKSPTQLTEQEKNNLSAFFFQTWSNETDTEPDLFSFNFAGYTGKFYINESGNSIPVPYQKLKIEGPNPFFTITTPDGVAYEFKAIEIVGGFTTMSYHLSKITHPEGDEINLYYRASGSYWYKSGISDNVYDFDWSSNSPICSSNVVQGYPYAKAHRTQVVSTLVLDSIVATGYAKVIFKTDDNRLDVPELRIKGLEVLNPAGEKIRAVELSHQFPYTTSYSNNEALFENGQYNGDNVYYRMFLDAVLIKDSQNHEVLRHEFEYNDLDELPIRLSYSQDHWGYFNGANNQNLLPDHIPAALKLSHFPGVATNADRIPNEEYVQKGMLRRMSHPTGGYTLFEYESNRDYSGNIQGGVRLREQKSYHFNGHQTSIKRYSYLNANVGSSLNYFRDYQFVTACLDFTATDNIYGPFQHNYHIYWLSSSPVQPPSHASYGKVIINYDDNNQHGREEHEFDNTQDSRDVQLYGQFPHYSAEMTNYGWKSGQKKTEKFYSKNHLVKSVVYDYDDDPRVDLTKSYVSVQEILPGAEGYVDYSHIATYFNVSRYSIISKWNYLRSKTITEYDQNGASPITTTIEYHYDNENHTQLTREVRTSSTGEVYTKQRFYPQDYTPVGSLGTLTDKFILSKIVDERVYYGNRLVSGSQIRYNDYGQPLDVYQAELNSSVLDVAFDVNNPFTFHHKASYHYNASRLLTTTNTDEDMSTSYIWSYNSTLPVARIENANQGDITLVTADLGANFMTALENTTNQEYIDGSLDALRAEISNDLPDARITTFTHYPLVGPRSSSDVNGKTTHFEYDDFGRVIKVKDHDLNILTSYSYHYVPFSALPKLEVSRVSVPFNYNSPSQTFEIISRGEWNLSDDRDWIHMSADSGDGDGTITVTVDENPSFVSRSGVITIQDASGHQLSDRRVTINQQAHPNYVNVSVSILTFGYTSQSKSFVITSAVSWDVTSSAPWVSANLSNGSGNSTITVTAAENTSFASRSATLTIRDLSGNNSPDQVITIEQVGSPSHLTANSTELNFQTAGGNKTVQVASNVSWAVTDNQSWLSVTPLNASGNGTVTVTATENTGASPRTGFVHITDQSGGGNMIIVSVTQPGTSDYITLSATSLYFDSNTLDAQFDIFSNLNSWSTRIIYISGYGWLDEIYPFHSFLDRLDVDVHVNQLPPSGQTWQAQIEVYNVAKGISAKIPVYVSN